MCTQRACQRSKYCRSPAVVSLKATLHIESVVVYQSGPFAPVSTGACATHLSSAEHRYLAQHANDSCPR